MPLHTQAKFRRKVRIWMVHQETTVTDLAKMIGRRRDTVSTAIHSGRFPRVRAQIEKAISS